MMNQSHSVIGRILAATLVGVSVFSGFAWATSGSGTTSVLVGPAAVFEPFVISMKRSFHLLPKALMLQTAEGSASTANASEKRGVSDGWDFEIEAKQGLSISTQTITFQPGGQSGWHTHPGPVFISVKEGTMTFYDENCVATVRLAGQGFLDTGTHPHLARNETAAAATNVVTYLAPPLAPTLRIDAPQPRNCRF